MNEITVSNLPDLGVEPTLRYNGKNLIEATYQNVNHSIYEITLYFSRFTESITAIKLNGLYIEHSYIEVSEDGELHIVIPG